MKYTISQTHKALTMMQWRLVTETTGGAKFLCTNKPTVNIENVVG